MIGWRGWVVFLPVIAFAFVGSLANRYQDVYVLLLLMNLLALRYLALMLMAIGDHLKTGCGHGERVQR